MPKASLAASICKLDLSVLTRLLFRLRGVITELSFARRSRSCVRLTAQRGCTMGRKKERCALYHMISQNTFAVRGALDVRDAGRQTGFRGRENNGGCKTKRISMNPR